jgi:hypothetical protein
MFQFALLILLLFQQPQHRYHVTFYDGGTVIGEWDTNQWPIDEGILNFTDVSGKEINLQGGAVKIESE